MSTPSSSPARPSHQHPPGRSPHTQLARHLRRRRMAPRCPLFCRILSGSLPLHASSPFKRATRSVPQRGYGLYARYRREELSQRHYVRGPRSPIRSGRVSRPSSRRLEADQPYAPQRRRRIRRPEPHLSTIRKRHARPPADRGSRTDQAAPRLPLRVPSRSVTGRLMSLVVAVEDVWTSLCYPRCPGGHGARSAGLRRAAQDWRGRLMSRLRSGAGAVWAPADACWLGTSRGRRSGELTGRRQGAVPEAQRPEGCGRCGQQPGWASAWRQTAVRRSPPARSWSCYRAVGCLPA
jgi:hypothetical protein